MSIADLWRKDEAKLAKDWASMLSNSSARKRLQIVSNQSNGAVRHFLAEQELLKKYPGAKVFSEKTIVGRDGKKLLDSTGRGRRIDTVLMSPSGRVLGLFEWSSPSGLQRKIGGKGQRETELDLKSKGAFVDLDGRLRSVSKFLPSVFKS